MTKTRAGVPAVLVAALLVAGCSGRGGETPASKTTGGSTTTAVVAKEDAAKAYRPLLVGADAAIEKEAAARDALAGDNKLSAAIDSTKKVRKDLFDFDTAMRKLAVPASATTDLNDLLNADRSYIAALDGFVDITTISAYNDQFDKETAARDGWYSAANALADALGVKGVDFSAGGSGTTTSAPPVAREVPAGQTVSSTSVSMTVPTGFTATALGTIKMTDGNGSTIGVYTQTPQSATTLDDVAKEAAQGTADKNGYKIIGGPEKLDVGDYAGRGYSFDTGDQRTEVAIYFEAKDSAGNQFHVIVVDAPDAKIDDVMNALIAQLPTVKVS